MMVPASPCANFIIRKPSFTLGSFKTVLYTMLSLDNSRQFFQSSVDRRIRKIIVILNFAFIINRARRCQKLFRRLMAIPFGSSNNMTTNNLDNKRAFFTIPNINLRPCFILQCIKPPINPLKRLFGRLASASIGRRFALEVTNIGVTWNRQKILFIQSPQIPSKTTRTAHFIISGYPAMRQIPAIVFKHIQSQFFTGLIANMFRHAAFLSPGLIICPLFRKIQSLIYQTMFFTRGVAHVNTHLPIVNFAKTTKPLSLYTHRIVAALLMPGGIEDNDTIIFANFSTYLPYQLLLQWLIIPRRCAYEFLKRFSSPVIAIGNRLDILSFQIRQKAAYVYLGVLFWLTSAKRSYKRLSKLFQSFHPTIDNLWLDISFFENLLFSYFKSSLHDSSFPSGLFPWKVCRINDLNIFSEITQYNYLTPVSGHIGFVATGIRRRI